MFGRMFGKKEDKALTAGEAIQKLRETEEMLMKKQEYMEKQIEQVSDELNYKKRCLGLVKLISSI